MTYLISDIHGNYEMFLQLLEKISFNSKRDKLIIIGDVLDWGKHGIEILEYLSPMIKTGEVILLKGNHELFCEMWLKGDLPDWKWELFGGKDTLDRVKLMSAEEQKKLLAFIEKLPILHEIYTEKFGGVVITHSGIDYNHYMYNEDGTINVVESIKEAVKSDEFHYLVTDDIHYIPPKELALYDKYIICGHVPTFRINEDRSNDIYVNSYYMVIDCGSGFYADGGTLGCYCIETDTAYYL